MDFPMEFFVVLNVFINVLFKVITNLNFYKHCFIKDDLQKYFVSQDGVLCAKEIYRPYGYKNLYPRKKPTSHNCDSIADKVSRLLPKLSL